jgi:hypothetical protein
MSADTGVSPSAVDLLLRAGTNAPPALAKMLKPLTETCRAPNGRAVQVVPKLTPG